MDEIVIRTAWTMERANSADLPAKLARAVQSIAKMPLQDDDEICFCFHVKLRKIRSFCRIERPKVASQISECLSAGTGCGWCRPMLRKIHQQECQVEEPWWRKIKDDEVDYHSAEREADAAVVEHADYAAGRQKYLKETGREPPADRAE